MSDTAVLLALLALLVVASTVVQTAFLARCLNRLPAPPEPVSLAPVLERIDNLRPPEPVSLFPILERIDAVMRPAPVPTPPVPPKPHRHQWRFNSEEVAGRVQRRIHICLVTNCRDTYVDESSVEQEGGLTDAS